MRRRSPRRRGAGVEGLYLNKTTAGGSWLYIYRAGGKQREKGLGPIAHITLAEARATALGHAAQRAAEAGHDPLRAEELARFEKEAAEKKRAVEAKKVTFAQAAKEFLEARAPTWKGRYARAQWWNPVKDYALPIIGDLLLDDIGVAHVVAVLKKVQDAPRKSDDDGKETARRMRARIEAVFNAAGALGQRDLNRQNPAGAELIKHVHPLKRKGERDHYRRIEELDGAPRALREILERAESDTRFAAWAFMILTAARPSEALEARWSEIDLARKLWTIPAGRMKGAIKHVVPLSAAAVEILKRQETVRRSDAVFPGKSGAPLSYNPFATAVKDAGTPPAGAASSPTPAANGCGSTATFARGRSATCLATSKAPMRATRWSRSAPRSWRPMRAGC